MTLSLARTCAAGPEKATRPVLRITTSSASSSAIFMFCSTSTIDWPCAFSLRDGAADLGDDERREAFGRLVQQQEPRVAHQRAADREHLLLAARERARVLLDALAQPRKKLEHAFEAPAGRTFPRIFPIGDLEVLAHREGGKHAPALRHEPRALARDRLGRQALDRLAEQAHRAPARAQPSDHRVHAGGLAGAVAAEEREHPALGDAERDRVQDVAVAVERVHAFEDSAGAFSYDISGQDRPPGFEGRRPLRRGSFDDHAAVVQHGDALGDVERGIHVVLDHHHGRLARDARRSALDGDPLFARQPGERLVEQQHPRLLRQRHRDLDPALVAVGHLGQRPLRQCIQADPLQYRPRLLVDRPWRNACRRCSSAACAGRGATARCCARACPSGRA